jgi:hypothetical protein
VAFSPDGQRVLTGNWDNTAQLWDVATGKEIYRLEGHSAWVYSVAVSPDGRWLATGSIDGTTRLWDAANGKELCILVSFRDGNWAVVDPAGRYDASNLGHVTGLHWVVGNETIGVEQLPLRNYVPDLLAKILKGETLPEVDRLEDLKLPAEVRVEPPAQGSTKLKVHLTNRGGGLGPVTVHVNGKEPEAIQPRGQQINPDAPEATLEIDLVGGPLTPGIENCIEVFARNEYGVKLTSDPRRGATLAWTPPGEADLGDAECYGVVAGVSRYAQDALNLSFAGKDARDVYDALKRAATNWFGPERVHLRLLTTAEHPDAQAPTKANLAAAFEGLKEADANDVVVIYLAGHGLALPGDRPTYCYLTTEATSLDPGDYQRDEAYRRSRAVSIDELMGWIAGWRANKLVMILDTCAAGTSQVVLDVKRDVPADQRKAWRRFRDGTGFWLLMGCAADRWSYETSVFGQGLLTYTLREGMAGQALREGEWVDVQELFQHAVERVPVLAGELRLGGVQQPQQALGEAVSFDLGRLTEEDKRAIQPAGRKPVLVRPQAENEDTDVDDLDLGPRLHRRLEAEMVGVGRGGEAFVYVSPLAPYQYPGSVLPKLKYRLEGEEVVVRVLLDRDKQIVARREVRGRKEDLEKLADDMVAALLEALETAPQ